MGRPPRHPQAAVGGNAPGPVASWSAAHGTVHAVARRAPCPPRRGDHRRRAPARTTAAERAAHEGRGARRRGDLDRRRARAVDRGRGVEAGVDRRAVLPGGAADHRPARRAARRAAGQPGRDRGRRDRVGQEHAAAEDLPGARARRAGARSATPSPGGSPPGPSPSASPRSSASRSGDRWATPSASPTRSATDTRVKVMTDGILLTEIAARPAAARLRHDHRRRGPRAQPEHRLHPRLPQAAPARAGPTSRSWSPRPPSTPSGSPSTSRRARPARSSRCRAGRTRSRCGTARSRTSEPRRTPCRPVADAVQELVREGPATSSCSRRASGRSATRPRPSRACGCPAPRSSPCSPACRRPSSTASSPATRGDGWCWPPTSPRPRSRCPASATSSTRARPASPGTASAPRCSACRSSRSRRPAADQRAGRCGRVAPGICIRLYAEDDFDVRPEFTEPEILRTNLASVILQMTAIGLGDVDAFPFVEPPDRRDVADGVDPAPGARRARARPPADDRRLTEVGRRLARLPLDPTPRSHGPRGRAQRLRARGAGHRRRRSRSRTRGSGRPDRRRRPAQLHARFRVPGSDFLGYLALWGHVQERQRALSSSAFRRRAGPSSSTTCGSGSGRTSTPRSARSSAA